MHVYGAVLCAPFVGSGSLLLQMRVYGAVLCAQSVGSGCVLPQMHMYGAVLCMQLYDGQNMQENDIVISY